MFDPRLLRHLPRGLEILPPDEVKLLDQAGGLGPGKRFQIGFDAAGRAERAAGDLADILKQAAPWGASAASSASLAAVIRAAYHDAPPLISNRWRLIADWRRPPQRSARTEPQMFVIPFPAIDPTLVEIGPFAIRWYALAYIVGLMVGWRYVRWLAEKPPVLLKTEHIDDLLIWITLGVILGGRIGYVLFYRPDLISDDPLAILQIWQGGMSFHGGLLGCVVAGYGFARAKGVPPLYVGDLCAAAGPIGLLLGRLANFVNGELWGRATDVSWAMVFPADRERLPRHPSQLYEAALEGIVLFVVLWLLARRESVRRRHGVLFGVFIAGYGLFRFLVEFAREPDAHLGFLYAGASMGQLLSLPMILIGLAILIWARRAPSE